MTQLKEIGNNNLEEITLWAIHFFDDNKEVLKCFNVNDPQQLIERLLSIPKIKDRLIPV